MKTIHLLDNSLINKIAAGEVVERPASVVKELAENSIDAGADKIIIEIKDGGIKLIKISDNGAGIPKEQVRLAFERHATSKLSSFDDLSSVLTFGFRGEALASVAAVSKTEIFTKTKEQEKGIHLEIDGGAVTKEEEAALKDGTVISVNNIFYNTPARRKFLKKPASESAFISETINHLALGNPQISFVYINNGNEILHTNGDGSLKNAVFYVYGRETAAKMLELESSKNGFTLKGLIGKPELSRANRNHGLFFINGRYIKSNIVREAIEDAYKGKMMIGKFPVYVLDLTVPSDTVDVNVHPAKLEVRFSDEDFIYSFIKAAVEDVFKNQVLIPKVSLAKEDFSEIVGKRPYKAEFQKTLEELLVNDCEDDLEENDTGVGIKVCENQHGSEIKQGRSLADKIYNKEPKIGEEDNKKAEKNEYVAIENPKEKSSKIISEEKKKAESKKEFFRDYKIIGQIFSTYWIVEMNNIMYLIDQHAAHERVLYEDLIWKIKNGDVVSQQLLKPIATNVDAAQKQAVKENIDMFEKFGFEIEEFGDNSYIIRAVPYVFENPASPEFFIELSDILSQGRKLESLYDTKEDAIATMSCKAAVKGNNKLSYVEAKALIEKMMKLENPFSCPHGRPTVVEISKYEVEKMFKRIQN